MKPAASVLYSQFIIDGVRQKLTPAVMLCLEDGTEDAGTIIDETVDACPGIDTPAQSGLKAYLDAVLSAGPKRFPVEYSEQYARIAVAGALTDALWRNGHFRIGDLALDLVWHWNDRKIGNMAAFYSAVHECASYIDELGLCIHSANYEDDGRIGVDAGVCLMRRDESDEDLLEDMPDHSTAPVLKTARACSASFDADPSSWIIYVPFDNCGPGLGGSLLAQELNLSGSAPALGDADYFADCFEIIREMVEDNVIVAGTTVREGGLICALKRMCIECGARVNIADVLRVCHEPSAEKVLFSEVPGVILQIRDIDYDYFDAEMLLQDVVFFPLGHPAAGCGLEVENSARSGIQSILDSLISNQLSEGED